MILDVLFIWQRDDGDVDWPVTTQIPLTDTSSGAEQEMAVDPFDNEYWTKIPLQ